jgi:hypothetical protein
MNHLPYKEWLLSEERLSNEQAQALKEHLRQCETCRQIEPAWTDVQVLFHKAPAAEPLFGFSGRWQSRLEKHKLRKQRRLAWIIMGGFSGIAAILLILFGSQLWEMVNAPGNIILLWVSRLTGILSIYWAIQNFFNGLAVYIPSIPWLFMIFGIGMVSFLSVLWLAAYRKLTLVRRLA